MDIAAKIQLTPREARRAVVAGVGSRFSTSLLRALLVPVGVLVAVAYNVLAGAAILLPGLAPLRVIWRVCRYLWSARQWLVRPALVRLTDESIECREEDFDVTYRWSMFTRMESGREFWFLHMTSGSIIYLPRRVFDADQQAEIDRFVADKSRGLPPA